MADKDPQEIDFTALAEAHSQEKGTNALTRLNEGFFERAVSFIKASYAKVEGTIVEGGVPDREALRMTGEHQRAREILEALYTTRERKVVLAALNASKGIDQRIDNMTDNEKDLFFNLKAELEEKRERSLRYDRMLPRPGKPRRETGIDTSTDDFVLPQQKEEHRPAREGRPEAAPVPAECATPRRNEADLQRTGVQRNPEGKGCLDGYIVVRALRDIGRFACGDGASVTLSRNDVATLPADIASVLVTQGMARTMEGGR